MIGQVSTIIVFNEAITMYINIYIYKYIYFTYIYSN
jgi:hypothetical protein